MSLVFETNGTASCANGGEVFDQILAAIAEGCDRHNLPAHDLGLAAAILDGEQGPRERDWAVRYGYQGLSAR